MPVGHSAQTTLHSLIYSLHMQGSTNELCYIQDFKSDHVLDLEDEPNGSVCKSNGAAAVFNPKADPPTDSQQWYLHLLPDGHYLVVSKLHGKVLTYQIDEKGHRKCLVSNSCGGQDQQRQDQQRQDQQRQDQQRQDQQRMKKEDSIVSVKYDFDFGKCVDIIADFWFSSKCCCKYIYAKIRCPDTITFLSHTCGIVV